MEGRARQGTLTVAEVREYDRRAIEELGIPSAVLMENAGRAVAEEILALELPEVARPLRDVLPRRVVVLVGPGNNGGDGYVIARHLAVAGAEVELYSTATRASLRGDAALYRGVADRMGLVTHELVTAHQLERERGRWVGADVLVDALLGTGFAGELRPHLARVLEALGSVEGAARVAVDLPSGLEADSGRAATQAFRADLTVSFVAAKPGFERGDGPAHAGRVVVRGIGAPRDLLEREL